MRRVSRVALMVAALTALAGCQNMTYTTDPGKGVYSGILTAPVVKNFNVSTKAHYLFWGLAPVATPSLERLAGKKLGAGQALAAIQIEEVNTFADGFLAAITLGIYRPRTVHVIGLIHNVEEGAR